MSTLDKRKSAFTDRTKRARSNASSPASRMVAPVPPPSPANAAPLRARLADPVEETQPTAELAPVPVPVQGPAVTAPTQAPGTAGNSDAPTASPAAGEDASVSQEDATLDADSPSGQDRATDPQPAEVQDASGDPAGDVPADGAAAGQGTAPKKAPRRRRSPRPTDTAGFTGELVDGFPVAVAGEAGMLQTSGEELHNTSMRVSGDLRRALHELVLWESDRVSGRVELERIIDAALLLLPDDLDAVESFLDAVPTEVRRAPQQPQNVGTRIRKSHFDRLARLPNRMGADGRRPVKLAEVHRAVLWTYWTQYQAQFRTGD